MAQIFFIGEQNPLCVDETAAFLRGRFAVEQFVPVRLSRKWMHGKYIYHEGDWVTINRDCVLFVGQFVGEK
jgi:hypothetical protein